MEEKWFEIIDDYLNGGMSPEERLRFELELKTNAALASVFNLYRTIEEEMRRDLTDYEEEVSLRNSLKALNTKYAGSDAQQPVPPVAQNPKPVVLMPNDEVPGINRAENALNSEEYTGELKRKTWKKLAVAAVVTGVVAASATWFFQAGKEGSEATTVSAKKRDTQNQSINPDTTSRIPTFPQVMTRINKSRTPQQQKRSSVARQPEDEGIDRTQLEAIYAIHTRPDTLPAPGERDMVLEEGDEQFENGQYKEAIASYNDIIARMRNPAIPTRGQDDDGIQLLLFYAYYYNGQSYMAMDSAAKAIPALLAAVKNSPDNYWKTKAQWYLALAYLKKGQLYKTDALLKQLVDNQQAGDYRQKAKELMDRLAKRGSH